MLDNHYNVNDISFFLVSKGVVEHDKVAGGFYTLKSFLSVLALSLILVCVTVQTCKAN